MRRCSKCKKSKQNEEFAKKRGAAWSSICKVCQREYNREHYKKNKRYYAEKAVVFKQRLREEVDKIKENTPCKDCGNLYPACAMDFDHVNGNKELEVANLVGNSMARSRIAREIAKCEIVCAVCHRIRTHERRMKARS